MPGNLVLTIDIGTTLRIGTDIELEVRQVLETGVRLAVRAPKEVPIVRSNAKVKGPKDQT